MPSMASNGNRQHLACAETMRDCGLDSGFRNLKAEYLKLRQADVVLQSERSSWMMAIENWLERQEVEAHLLCQASPVPPVLESVDSSLVMPRGLSHQHAPVKDGCMHDVEVMPCSSLPKVVIDLDLVGTDEVHRGVDDMLHQNSLVSGQSCITFNGHLETVAASKEMTFCENDDSSGDDCIVTPFKENRVRKSVRATIIRGFSNPNLESTPSGSASGPFGQRRASRASHMLNSVCSVDAEDAHRRKALQLSRSSSTTMDSTDSKSSFSRRGRCTASRRWVRTTLTHPVAESFIAMCIVVNSVLVSVEVDWTAKNPRSATPPLFFLALGSVLNVIFFFEVALRIFGQGLDFFCGSQQVWNIFDSILVLASLCELVLGIADAAGHLRSGNFYSVRLVRIFRITRLLRVIRVARIVRLLMTLRLLLIQINGTLRACFWALVLLFIILYLFGMTFAEMTSEYLLDHDDPDQLLAKYWGSVPRCIFSLYKAVTGGIDWELIVNPLSSISWFCVFLFNVFLAFTIFAVLNVVVGVFCQSAITSAANDYDNFYREKVREKQEFTHRCLRLFETLVVKGSLTFRDLEDRLDSAAVRASFEHLGVDPSDAWDLFKLLDKDASALITSEDFVQGCFRLRGLAKAIDIEKLNYENRQMRKRLSVFMVNVEKALSMLCPDVPFAALQSNHRMRASVESM